MTEHLIYSTEDNRYVQYEMQSKSRINRRCIDGSFTGCGNCVGYCQYREHPGFLTQKQRKEHNCIDKQCHYYIPKPQRMKQEKSENLSSVLLASAKQFEEVVDDLCIINACCNEGTWVIGYVTVFGQYDFSDMEQKIQRETGITVIMKKLDYGFERCVDLICSRC